VAIVVEIVSKKLLIEVVEQPARVVNISITEPVKTRLVEIYHGAKGEKGSPVEISAYTATGNEGLTLEVPELDGNSVLLLFAGDKLLKKVSADPGVNEFIQDNTLLTFGVELQEEQVLTILFKPLL
jgi:hypothetical protein